MIRPPLPSSRSGTSSPRPSRADLRLARTSFAFLALCGASAAQVPQRDDASAFAADARDATAEDIAFVELASSEPAYVLGQAVELTITFGVEVEFLRDWAVPPFPTPLDVPVQLDAPWVDGFAGVLAVAGEPANGATFALGESVRRARALDDTERAGKRYRAFAFEARFLPATAGTLRFPAPRLLLTHATRFEDNLFGGRVPMDRQTAFVVGAEHAVEVRELPEAGRPFDFTGAVGRFRMRASASAREVAVGASLRLELTLEGEGNLFTFPAPRWQAPEGFHLLGTLDQRREDARVFALDLAPTSARVRAIPAFALTYFDAERSAYAAATSEPLSIVVQAPGPNGSGMRTSGPAAPDPDAPERAPTGDSALPRFARGRTLSALAAAIVAWLVWRLRPRRR